MSTEQWTEDRVARWLAAAPELERQLAPVSQALYDAASLAVGDHVLDVGCGTGPTTREVAGLVGPSGRVTGLDVAGPLLEAAAAASGAPDAAEIAWECADVVTWAAPESSYDVVLSRFGVMFFSDPAAAVATLASAARPGGRLCVAVWGPRDSSALFETPYQAARRALADAGADVPPESPIDEGPYSWSDPDYVLPLLAGAGWRDADIATAELVLPVAGGAPAPAARMALDFGPTRALVADRGADERAVAERAVLGVFEAAADASGQPHLSASVRLITARR